MRNNFLKLSLLLLFAVAFLDAQEKDKKKYYGLLSITGKLGYTVYKDSPVIPVGSAGQFFAIGLGLDVGHPEFGYLSVAPMYRWHGLGGVFSKDLMLRGLYVPVLAKFLFVNTESQQVLIGLGSAYYEDMAGFYNNGLANQGKFDLPAADLRSGWGLMGQIEFKQALSHNAFYSMAVGIDNTKRSYNIDVVDFFARISMYRGLF